MKKNIITLFILALVTFVGCSRGNNSNQKDKKFHNGLTDINCSHLSNAQKKFASQLSNMHRQIYCKIFSDSQRNKAINLVENSKKYKSDMQTSISPMSPDQAVENIMKANRENKN
jgi:hypothetical protein